MPNAFIWPKEKKSARKAPETVRYACQPPSGYIWSEVDIWDSRLESGAVMMVGACRFVPLPTCRPMEESSSRERHIVAGVCRYFSLSAIDDSGDWLSLAIGPV